MIKLLEGILNAQDSSIMAHNKSSLHGTHIEIISIAFIMLYHIIDRLIYHVSLHTQSYFFIHKPSTQPRFRVRNLEFLLIHIYTTPTVSSTVRVFIEHPIPKRRR